MDEYAPGLLTLFINVPFVNHMGTHKCNECKFNKYMFGECNLSQNLCGELLLMRNNTPTQFREPISNNAPSQFEESSNHSVQISDLCSNLALAVDAGLIPDQIAEICEIGAEELHDIGLELSRNHTGI